MLREHRNTHMERLPEEKHIPTKDTRNEGEHYKRSTEDVSPPNFSERNSGYYERSSRLVAETESYIRRSSNNNSSSSYQTSNSTANSSSGASASAGDNRSRARDRLYRNGTYTGAQLSERNSSTPSSKNRIASSSWCEVSATSTNVPGGNGNAGASVAASINVHASLSSTPPASTLTSPTGQQRNVYGNVASAVVDVSSPQRDTTAASSSLLLSSRASKLNKLLKTSRTGSESPTSATANNSSSPSTISSNSNNLSSSINFTTTTATHTTSSSSTGGATTMSLSSINNNNNSSIFSANSDVEAVAALAKAAAAAVSNSDTGKSPDGHATSSPHRQRSRIRARGRHSRSSSRGSRSRSRSSCSSSQRSSSSYASSHSHTSSPIICNEGASALNSDACTARSTRKLQSIVATAQGNSIYPSGNLSGISLSSSSSNSSCGSNSILHPITHSDDNRPLVIRVRNLPLRSSDTSLKDGLFHEYKKHGKVKWVKVVGQSTDRYALVCFKKHDDVVKSLEVSRDKLFFGCKIDVEPYEGYDVDDNESRPYEAELDEYHPKATRTLFIGNLDIGWTQTELRSHFEPFGEIIEVEIKKQGINAYAFCQYADIVSVVKAIRQMDGEHLGGNRVKLGFGKSMPTNCVWIDGVSEKVTEKNLQAQFSRYGNMTNVVIDRTRQLALIQYDQIQCAQTAVKEMRGKELRGRKLQVDFASRECQDAFYRKLEAQTTTTTRFARYESTTRSRASSFSRHQNSNDGCSPSHTVSSNSSSSTISMVNVPTVPSAIVAGASSNLPSLACVVVSPSGSTTPGRSRLARSVRQTVEVDCLDTRRFRSCDEYSQGSAASHDDEMPHSGAHISSGLRSDSPLLSRLGPIVNQSLTGGETLEVTVNSGNGRRRCDKSPSKTKGDMRTVQKERSHLLDNSVECPSSGDESTSKRCKLDFHHHSIDSGCGSTLSHPLDPCNNEQLKLNNLIFNCDAPTLHESPSTTPLTPTITTTRKGEMRRIIDCSNHKYPAHPHRRPSNDPAGRHTALSAPSPADRQPLTSSATHIFKRRRLAPSNSAENNDTPPLVNSVLIGSNSGNTPASSSSTTAANDHASRGRGHQLHSQHSQEASCGESADGSRPGTPLCDERPEVVPSEPRGLPRERPREIMSLPIPKFGIAWLQQYLKTTNALRYHPPTLNSLSGTTSSMSSVQSNASNEAKHLNSSHPPPSGKSSAQLHHSNHFVLQQYSLHNPKTPTTLAGGIASMSPSGMPSPLRSRSLSSDSSDDDATGKDLAERIRYLDERYENWRSNSANTNVSSSFSKIRHDDSTETRKSSNFDMNSTPMSDIAMTVLSRKSLFDNDYERLKMNQTIESAVPDLSQFTKSMVTIPIPSPPNLSTVKPTPLMSSIPPSLRSTSSVIGRLASLSPMHSPQAQTSPPYSSPTQSPSVGCATVAETARPVAPSSQSTVAIAGASPCSLNLVPLPGACSTPTTTKGLQYPFPSHPPLPNSAASSPTTNPQGAARVTDHPKQPTALQTTTSPDVVKQRTNAIVKSLSVPVSEGGDQAPESRTLTKSVSVPGSTNFGTIKVAASEQPSSGGGNSSFFSSSTKQQPKDEESAKQTTSIPTISPSSTASKKSDKSHRHNHRSDNDRRSAKSERSSEKRKNSTASLQSTSSTSRIDDDLSEIDEREQEKTERERQEREKLEKEKQEKQSREKERQEREKREKEARKQQEREEREQREREEKEREREEKERKERERDEKERKQREREEREREEKERKLKREQEEREEKERKQREREERDRKDKEERERKEKEEHERKEREERKAKEEGERREREETERRERKSQEELDQHESEIHQRKSEGSAERQNNKENATDEAEANNRRSRKSSHNSPTRLHKRRLSSQDSNHGATAQANESKRIRTEAQAPSHHNSHSTNREMSKDGHHRDAAKDVLHRDSSKDGHSKDGLQREPSKDAKDAHTKESSSSQRSRHHHQRQHSGSHTHRSHSTSEHTPTTPSAEDKLKPKDHATSTTKHKSRHHTSKPQTPQAQPQAQHPTSQLNHTPSLENCVGNTASTDSCHENVFHPETARPRIPNTSDDEVINASPSTQQTTVKTSSSQHRHREHSTSSHHSRHKSKREHREKKRHSTAEVPQPATPVCNNLTDEEMPNMPHNPNRRSSATGSAGESSVGASKQKNEPISRKNSSHCSQEDLSMEELPLPSSEPQHTPSSRQNSQQKPVQSRQIILSSADSEDSEDDNEVGKSCRNTKYVSMYDKVKARSCKNMPKPEADETIKAKFSQLKQSRAKRVEKKRSTSYDGDSDSEFDENNQRSGGSGSYRARNRSSSDDVVDTHDEKRRSSQSSTQLTQRMFSDSDSGGAEAEARRNKLHYNLMRLCDADSTDGEEERNSPSKRITQKRHSYTSRIASDSESQPQSATETAAGKCVNTNECDTKDVKPIKKELMINQNSDFEHKSSARRSSISSVEDQKIVIKSEHADLMSKSENYTYFGNALNIFDYNMQQAVDLKVEQEFSPETRKKHKKSKRRQKTPTSSISLDSPQGMVECKPYIGAKVLSTNELPKVFDPFDELKRDTSLVSSLVPVIPQTPTNHDASDTSASERKRHKERRERKRDKLKSANDASGSVDLDKSLKEERQRLKKSKKSKSLDVMRTSSVPTTPSISSFYAKSNEEKMEDIFGPISDESEFSDNEFKAASRAPSPATPSNAFMMANISTPNTALMMDSITTPLSTAASVESHCKQEQLNPYKQEPLTPKSHTVEENEENKQKLFTDQNENDHRARKERRDKKRKEREQSRETHALLSFQQPKHIDDENSVDLDAAGRALEAQLMEDCDNKTTEDATPSTATTYHSNTTDAFRFSDGDENSVELLPSDRVEVLEDSAQKSSEEVSTTNDLEVAPNELQECHQYKDKKKKKKRSKDEKHHHHHHQRRESSSSATSSQHRHHHHHHHHQHQHSALCPKANKQSAEPGATSSTQQFPCKEHAADIEGPPQVQISNPSPSLPCLIGDDDIVAPAIVVNEVNSASTVDRLSISPMREQQMISPIPNTPTVGHGMDYEKPKSPAPPTATQLSVDVTPLPATQPFSPTTDSNASSMLSSPHSSTSNKKKPEIFIPGFDGELDEKISESAVQSISAEFNSSIVDHHGDEPKIPIESPPDATKHVEKIENTKSRVTISQEETESAVSALLGESFGNSSDFSFVGVEGLDDMSSVDTTVAPAEPDEEAALAAQAIETATPQPSEDCLEVSNAVQSLTNAEIDIKADTPQSERELQIDTDNEDNVYVAESNANNLKIDENVLDSLEETLSSEREEVKDKISDHELQSTCSAPTVITKIELESSPNQPKIQADTADTNVTKAIELQTEQPQPVLPSMMSLDTATVVHEDKTSPVAPADILVNESRSALTEQAPKLTIEPSTITLPSSPADFPPPQALLSPRGNGSNEMAKFSPQQHGDFVNVQSPQMSAGSPRGNTPTPQLQSQVIPNQRVPLSPQPQLLQTTGMPLTNHSSPMPCPTTTANVGPLIQRINATTVSKPVDGQQPKANNFALPSRSNHNQQLPPKSVIEQLSSQSHMMPLTVQKLPPVPSHPAIISKIVNVQPHQATLTEFYQGKPMFATAPTHQNPPTQLHEFQKSTAPSSPRQQQPFQQQKMVLQERPRQLHGNANVSGQHPVILQNHFAGNPVSTYMAHPNAKEKLHPPTTEHLEVSHSERKKCPKPIINELLAVIEMEEAAKSIKAKANKLQEDATLVAVAQKLNSVAEAVSVIRSPTPTNGGKNSIIGKDFRFLLTEENIKKIAPPKDEVEHDSKEDSDYWSAKEANIETVLKKVDEVDEIKPKIAQKSSMEEILPLTDLQSSNNTTKAAEQSQEEPKIKSEGCNFPSAPNVVSDEKPQWKVESIGVTFNHQPQVSTQSAADNDTEDETETKQLQDAEHVPVHPAGVERMVPRGAMAKRGRTSRGGRKQNAGITVAPASAVVQPDVGVQTRLRKPATAPVATRGRKGRPPRNVVTQQQQQQQQQQTTPQLPQHGYPQPNQVTVGAGIVISPHVLTAAEKKARSQSAASTSAAEDSDIYEFHEDSGEESKTASAQTNPAAKGDARPRLILTIKSPGQTQPIVKTHVKPAAPLAALSVTVTDNAGPTSQVQTTDKTAIQRAPSSEPMAPEASSLPAVLSPGNTRKSRRLLEKDRSTVDDIIDAVVRNTQTSSTDGAAASPQKPAEVHPRRSGRNANGKKADASPNAATTVVRLRRSKDRKSSVDSVPSVGDTASDTEKVGAHESQAVSQVKPLIEPISRGVSEERNYQPSERHFNDSSQLPMNHIVVNEKDQTTVSIPQPQQMQPQPQLQVQQQNQAQAQQQYQEQDQSQQQPHQKQHQPQQQSHSQQQLQQQQQVQQQSHQQQQPLQLQHHPNAPIQHQAQPQNQPHQQLVSHHPFPTTMHPKKKVLMSAEIDSLAAVNSAIPSAGHPILHSAAPASQKTTGGAADAANKALIDPVTGMISGMQQGKEGNLPSATAAAASQTHRTPTNPKKKIQAAVAAAAAAENALHSDVRQHMSPIQNKMAAPIATPITTLTKPVQIEAAAAMLTKPAGMINKPVGVVLKSSTAPLVIQQIIPPQGGVTKQPIVVQQSPVGMQAQVSNARPKSLKAHVLNHQKINQQQYQQPQQQQQQPQQQQQMPSISQQQQGLSHVIQSNIIGRQQLTTGQQQQLLVIPPTHSPHGAAQLNSPRLHHQQQPQLVIKQGQAVPQTQQQLLHIVSSKTAVNHANKQQQVYTGPTQQQLAVMQMEQGLQQQHAKSMAVQQQQQHLSKQQVAAPVAHQQQLPAKQQHKLQQATTMVLQPGIIGLPPHMILQSKTPLHLQPHQLTPSPPLQQGKGTPGVHNLQTQSGPIITSISSPPPTAAHKQQQPAGVTGPSNLRTSIPAISPQGQARVTPLLLPSGMPLTPYEASLHDIGGYSVTSIGQSPPPAHQQASPITPGDPSFAAGALRGVSPRDHYMLYHPLLRTQEHNNSLQFEEKILGSSPPLELRRPASVTRTITVPHSLQSPQDRTSDSPQAAQVYVHNSRIPHPYSEIASRVFYESGRPISIEPPPAHRSTPHNVVAPPPVVVPPSGTGSTSPFIGAPGVQPPPSTPTSASTAAHMHPKLIERERERGRDREQALERERERELNQQRRDNEQLNARTVNSPQQRPNQVASPQGDSLLTLLQRYPVMWQGLLALKTDQAAVQMHFVFGNPHVARMSLPCNSDGSTPPLRIAQRMRLEQTQLEGVAKKMQFENEHCILLALPCGRDHADVLLQSRNLQTGFITYMQQKAAAGIVNIPLANSDQAAYVVHIFPSCDFANENLERAAPDLKNRVAEIAHLLIVIATV